MNMVFRYIFVLVVLFFFASCAWESNAESEFLKAFEKGDTQILEYYLKHKPELATTTYKNMPLLHYAIAAKSAERVQFLLNYEVTKVYLEKRVLAKPIFWAIAQNGCDLEIVKALYENGVRIDSKSMFKNNNVLLEAVEVGQYECAKYFYELSCKHQLQFEKETDLNNIGLLEKAIATKNSKLIEFVTEVLKSGCPRKN